MDIAPVTEMVYSPYEQYETRLSEVVQEVNSALDYPYYLDEDVTKVTVSPLYLNPAPDVTHEISMISASEANKEIVSDDINSERLELLVEKYVKQHWFHEMEARLQIDHKKVEMLHPRVTAEQIQAINDLREQLQESGDQILEMLDDLGIK